MHVHQKYFVQKRFTSAFFILLSVAFVLLASWLLFQFAIITIFILVFINV